MCYLPDPCPLPEKIKKRSLVDKERLVYAPFSGVGGIVYDKDAVYVELGGSHSHSKVCFFFIIYLCLMVQRIRLFLVTQSNISVSVFCVILYSG